MTTVAAAAPPVKPEPKMDVDMKPAVAAPTNNNTGVPVNRGGGGRGRRMRGGGGGPGRGFFGGGGRGGGGHDGGARRPFNNGGDGGGYDGPMKRAKMGGGGGGGPHMHPETRTLEKIRGMTGPTADLPPKKFEVKKFAANTRLYIGNISNEATESDIKELFAPFGEVDEVFLNREKNFAFLKLDFRTSAERARAELDQAQVKNRPIKVRFAPANVRIKVKNLSPMVSNELLELAFSAFGEIERALVFVDSHAKSLGEGFVEFTRKNNALAAHKFCSEKCFFLTSDLRPVVTEIGEMNEVDEGLLEGNLNKREYNQDREMVYYKAREVGPRVAQDGFENEYGQKWKALISEFQEKEKALKDEMQAAVEKLHQQMEMARYDYETEMLRQQLRQREMDHERQKAQWERMGMGGGGFGYQQQNNNGGEGIIMDAEMGGGGGGGSMMFSGGGQPLAPPPMPPQGLLSQLQGGGGGEEELQQGGGPTWEIGPFGQDNNFGQPPVLREPRFMGGGSGGPRGGGGGFRGGPRGGGGGRGFGGGRGGGRGGMRR